jgi:hypothetical protein
LLSMFPYISLNAVSINRITNGIEWAAGRLVSVVVCHTHHHPYSRFVKGLNHLFEFPDPCLGIGGIGAFGDIVVLWLQKFKQIYKCLTNGLDENMNRV